MSAVPDNQENTLSDVQDVGDLHQFGYVQSLRRTLGPYGSFAIAFSMISITTAIFFLLPSLFGTAGAAGVWLWIPCAAGVFLIVLVYAHLAARIPITGFAYQWNSRLINPHYGWFTGYTALLAFMAGTAATAVALATVFASDVWTSPTHGDIVLFATLAMAAAALINIISIRAVSAVNNTGVFFEITGSVGAAALLFFGAIFFFHHDAGFSILVSTQRTAGGSLWYGFVLAALLPLYCFIGWEGAADLAEETNDPRAVTPFAMIRANYVSVAASLFMIVGFLIAIPAGVGKLLGQPKNPLVYIFQSHFGAVAADILQVVVFLAIFSCVLANMVVATRLTFALSRDKMLPGSGVLGHVNATTRTPIASILLVAAVGIGINLLSAGVAANVVSICSVAYYFIYALTVGGAIYAYQKKTMPAGDRHFSLGRWFMPVAGAAVLYAAAVIVIALAPHEGHTAAEYLFGAEVLGALWYVLYLRARISNQSAGVLRKEVTDLEHTAQASSPAR
jgi:amino acid transporter